ncbi:hypothetical protein [Synechococcus sp. CBW1108]|jgi:hypothetical protein|uniref:hypothetical protein n=1 Tax=Synechococcus sp. CBW1108 TaxID=1353147 RepID=UPI0018CE1323|nr:hypothetical protein [Synechococcus sp. CBW1108]QPN70423.1 hypothetical protein H8F27_01655 [Synechococcus sp. CBW1108]
MKSGRRREKQLYVSGKPAKTRRRVFRGRQLQARLRQVGTSFLLGGTGVGLILALLQVPDRFDTFLVLSKALVNLIEGVKQALWGVLQLLSVLLLVLAAAAAVALVVLALIRLIQALWPQPPARP